jgi:hypothetical protein
MRQMVILRERFNRMYQESEDMANDPSADGQARVNSRK